MKPLSYLFWKKGLKMGSGYITWYWGKSGNTKIWFEGKTCMKPSFWVHHNHNFSGKVGERRFFKKQAHPQIYRKPWIGFNTQFKNEKNIIYFQQIRKGWNCPLLKKKKNCFTKCKKNFIQNNVFFVDLISSFSNSNLTWI